MKHKTKESEEAITSPHHSKKKLFIWQIISGILFVALVITILLAVIKPNTDNKLVNTTETTEINQKIVTEYLTMAFLAGLLLILITI